MPQPDQGQEQLVSAELVDGSCPRVCLWTRRCSDGSVSWLSSGFFDLFGRDPGPFLGRSDLRELVHPLDLARFVGDSGDIDDRRLLWRTVRPDGETLWVRSQVVAIVEMPVGEHQQVSVIEDVTGEEAGRRRRRELEATFADLSFALNDADAEDLDEAIDNGLSTLGELVGADRSYLFRLHGAGLLSNTHEWCAKGVDPAIDMLQNQVVADFAWAMERLGEGPQVMAVAALPPEAGELRPVLEAQGIIGLVLVPTFLRGQVTGFVGFDSVVDPRDWHDDDIEILERFARSVQSALDRADAQRHSREILAELMAARDAAETASDAKSQLLSRVSHELRTPASIVVTSAELLAREALDPAGSVHVERILRSAREQLAMIDDLLEVARADRPRAATVSEVDVAQLCSDILTAGTDLTPLGSSLQAEGPVTVCADPALVRRVVSNLVSNAVKYNRLDGRVDVQVEGSDEGVQIQITDTGRGIDADGLEVLWNPFERLGAESGDVPGTGLGLAIVAQALDELGGTVEVDSSPAGSTFTVWLPCVDDARLASAAVSILLVDDHDAVRTITETVLRKVGGFNDIRHATTCAELIEEATRELPSIVLMDRHLPDGTCESMIPSLRALPGGERLPVVIVTADATEASRRRSLDAGADDYVVKPAPVTELVELVRSLVLR